MTTATGARLSKKKIKRAADLANELGQPVAVGEFIVHPKAAANDADDEGKRVQKQLDAMGAKR